MKTMHFYLFGFLLFCLACQGTKKSKSLTLDPSMDDGQIEFTFLQINDVYEIAPIEGGAKGGMARVATLKKKLEAEQPRLLTILSGDFLNPSVIGTLKYQGKRIKGAHMIDVMNHLGVDLVTFGNHEFDLNYSELQERLNESNAVWLGTNVLYTDSDKVHSFYQQPEANTTKDGSSANKYIQEMWIWDIEDEDGTKAKIGFFGATINSNPVDYVIYEDFRAEAVKAYQFLDKHTDLVIGVTHLEVSEDMELAKLLPEVPLLMGGHEHEHMEHQIGTVRIAKADANAKTAYVHKVQLNTKTDKAKINSSLVPLDETVPLDPEVDKVVGKWNDIADQLYSKEGFNIKEVITEVSVPLDGKDASIRHQQTNLGKVITRCMSNAYNDENDCAILNSGSIRIDDEISGQITQFDIIRAMPFGGGIAQVQMTGAALRKALDFAINKPGNGAYLQWDKIELVDGKGWKINGKLLEDDKKYWVILNDFLLRGLDIPSLKEGNDGLLIVNKPKKGDLKTDIRLLLIDYLKNT
jgi:2',3'-cyclic-nucleotide 2'-phosphodiesterase (5'-nucleotidase family)